MILIIIILIITSYKFIDTVIIIIVYDYRMFQRAGRRGLDTGRSCRHDNRSERRYSDVELRPLKADRACPTDLGQLKKVINMHDLLATTYVTY